MLQSSKNRAFDLLVIGGGATGSGILLDAQSRGLKACLVEAGDFSSQTSSRSTKLIHGGVRYLEQAFFNLDYSQIKLVKEALKERHILFKIAPGLVHPLPILIPAYSLWDKIWYYGGMKIYDALAGSQNLERAKWVSKKEAIDRVPSIKKEGLSGGIIFTDGQFDDARMGLSLILTAIDKGAVAVNYVKVLSLNPIEVEDTLTGTRWQIDAARVVNATGPFADSIRKMENPDAKPIIEASRGSHLVIDSGIAGEKTGLLIPKTSDGRVIYCLPWQGKSLVGTTEIACEAEFDPKISEEEILYLLKHLGKWLDVAVGREKISAEFSGIRPLVRDDKSKDTSKIVRDYLIETSVNGLITIAGGKWTTYRKMAEAVVDLLSDKPCTTDKIQLLERQRPNTFEEEVRFAIHREMACTAEDILFRRSRLGVLDAARAWQLLPLVEKILEQEKSL